MKVQNNALTGREITFGEHEIIVSKTDERGIITYANTVFQRVAGYTEAELIGQPHNLIRHPAMPMAVFKLLWDTIKAGNEIFAYVLNQAKNGDEYWVFAHVTPSYDLRGNRVGYHSNRRFPHRDAISKVTQLYSKMVAEEKKYQKSTEAMEASTRILMNELQKAGQDYDEFVFNLSKYTSLDSALQPSSYSRK